VYLEQSIALDEALGVAIQVAMALEAAHAAGIIHRDIKPEKHYVAAGSLVRDRFVKVLDFGLAKLTESEGLPLIRSCNYADHKTNPGAIIGTPATCLRTSAGRKYPTLVRIFLVSV